MTEVWIINGHAPWCSYIQTLGDICVDEEPCDCAGWDDDEGSFCSFDDDDEWSQ